MKNKEYKLIIKNLKKENKKLIEELNQLKKLIEPESEPEIDQCGTVTGRLSSNLQNVSKGAKDEFELGLGKYRELIRPIFKAREVEEGKQPKKPKN